ncbi:glycosyltransferase family 9 protein [Dyadobacter psychrophilus]|uniref:ADP-heptose:LPS heptosyltransferase n=1 Tax=Dyadobacter psychrophilus TaxID=651661 RepID=A0A1T5E9F4_9BACT|nr:glycosyltransferase family 9 protein [Dyadobacter psychrophilus]SKB80658.1 ADP-heptose:LPS heptosyltransferase [Dyadobacter psychrophilus]
MKFPADTTHKIAVFRALQLGDMLCSVPALRALRKQYPDAEITLLGLPWASGFTERFSSYIDKFIHFPGYHGLPEQPFDQTLWNDFVSRMQQEKFDLILQMQGSGGIVNDMLESLRAGPVAGFHSAGSYRESGLFTEYPNGISEIEKHLLMLANLGIQPQGTALEFPVNEMETEHLNKIKSKLPQGPYVCVHPGSRGAWRQWPTTHFACLADQCAGMGFQVYVTGTKEEADITAEVIDLMDFPAIDLTGKTNLGEIGQLIKDAKLLISNCTGVSHIAAAMETPSIVISMDGEPERWGPLNKDLHKTIDWTKAQDFNSVLALVDVLRSPVV